MQNRRSVSEGRAFTDDCGTWTHSPTPVSRLVQNGESWQNIILHRGTYGTFKQNGRNITFVRTEPQPREEDVLNVHRKYSNTLLYRLTPYTINVDSIDDLAV